MSAYSHPHTIQDGNGSSMTFERVEGTGAQARLIVTNVVAPGAGPPMHVHHLQKEGLTVEAGQIGYQVAGQPEQTAGPGEKVDFAAGVAHRFWNCGQEELRCTGYISPPHNVEYFLTQIYESTRRNGGERPRAFDGAWLLRRYREEFAMLDIPGPVQRFVFPVQVAIGRLMGWHRRFDGSPQPVREGAR